MAGMSVAARLSEHHLAQQGGRPRRQGEPVAVPAGAHPLPVTARHRADQRQTIGRVGHDARPARSRRQRREPWQVPADEGALGLVHDVGDARIVGHAALGGRLRPARAAEEQLARRLLAPVLVAVVRVHGPGERRAPRVGRRHVHLGADGRDHVGEGRRQVRQRRRSRPAVRARRAGRRASEWMRSGPRGGVVEVAARRAPGTMQAPARSAAAASAAHSRAGSIIASSGRNQPAVKPANPVRCSTSVGAPQLARRPDAADQPRGGFEVARLVRVEGQHQAAGPAKVARTAARARPSR